MLRFQLAFYADLTLEDTGTSAAKLVPKNGIFNMDQSYIPQIGSIVECHLNGKFYQVNKVIHHGPSISDKGNVEHYEISVIVDLVQNQDLPL